MAAVVTWVAAAVCAPTMAIVGRLIDSADDRRERAQLFEHNRLRQQLEGPEEGPSEGERTAHERD